MSELDSQAALVQGVSANVVAESSVLSLVAFFFSLMTYFEGLFSSPGF